MRRWKGIASLLQGSLSSGLPPAEITEALVFQITHNSLADKFAKKVENLTDKSYKAPVQIPLFEFYHCLFPSTFIILIIKKFWGNRIFVQMYFQLRFIEFIPVVHAHYNIMISLKFGYYEHLNMEKIKSVFQKD